MTTASYGATTRRPVYSGTRRIAGLYERTTRDSSTVYEAAIKVNGRVMRRRLSATTKTDAIREVAELRVDAGRGELHRSAQLSPTLAELTVDYVAHLETRLGDPDPKHRRSPRTVANARYRLERYVLPTLGRVRAAELDSADVVRLLDALSSYVGQSGERLSPNTRTAVLSTLSGLLRFGVKRGLVERNVVRDVDRDDRPGTKRLTEPRYLDAAELQRLLERLSDTFRPIAATYAFAGLRASEALGLRWRDLNLETGTMSVEHQLGLDGKLHAVKTEASRAMVRLLPELRRELVAHRKRQAAKNIALVAPDALVFVTATGRPHSARNVLRAVHRAGELAALNLDDRERVGLHDLRHTLVAQAFEHGRTLPEASALARHANPRVTAQVYAGLSEKSREQVWDKLADSGYGA